MQRNTCNKKGQAANCKVRKFDLKFRSREHYTGKWRKYTDCDTVNSTSINKLCEQLYLGFSGCF